MNVQEKTKKQIQKQNKINTSMTESGKCTIKFQKWNALLDLVPFAQFKKREKHTWRIVAFNKVAGFSLKLY